MSGSDQEGEFSEEVSNDDEDQSHSKKQKSEVKEEETAVLKKQISQLEKRVSFLESICLARSDQSTKQAQADLKAKIADTLAVQGIEGVATMKLETNDAILSGFSDDVRGLIQGKLNRRLWTLRSVLLSSCRGIAKGLTHSIEQAQVSINSIEVQCTIIDELTRVDQKHFHLTLDQFVKTKMAQDIIKAAEGVPCKWYRSGPKLAPITLQIKNRNTKTAHPPSAISNQSSSSVSPLQTQAPNQIQAQVPSISTAPTPPTGSSTGTSIHLQKRAGPTTVRPSKPSLDGSRLFQRVNLLDN